MNPCFLEGFQRRSLSVSKTGLRTALGEGPAPAAARANQEELDVSAADAVANRSHLLAFAQFSEVRQAHELAGRLARGNWPLDDR